MSDAKNKLPGIPKTPAPAKNKPPMIRGGTEPVREVKLVAPDQVKTRRQAAAGDKKNKSAAPPAG